MPNPVNRDNPAVLSLLDVIAERESTLRNIVTLVRGDDDSYDNAIAGLVHDFASGRTMGRQSVFPQLVGGRAGHNFINDALSASFDDVLRGNRDLFWLQDLADGGFAVHTPQGRMIIGAERSSFSEDEINSAILAIFVASSGMRMKAPVLGQLDFSAVIDGNLYPFDRDAITSDMSFKVERLNNYEVMIEGYKDKRWTVSLLDQFSERVSRISEPEEYMQAWESLSHDLYFLVEKIWMKLQRVSERPEEIAGNDGYDLSAIETVSQMARPLKRLFSAFQGFRKNLPLRERWERSFVIGLIEHMTDRFPWLKLVDDLTASDNLVTLGRILGSAEAVNGCRDIYCPLSIMRAFGADRETHPWLKVEVNATQGIAIATKHNKQLQRLITRLIFLMGASHRYDSSPQLSNSQPLEQAHVAVEWIEKEGKLMVRDMTESRSAFAALDPKSDGRNELERIAESIGGKINYLLGSVAITIPTIPSPAVSVSPIGGLNRMSVKPILFR